VEQELTAEVDPFGNGGDGRIRTVVTSNVVSLDVLEKFTRCMLMIAQQKRLNLGMQQPKQFPGCVEHFTQIAVDNGKFAKHGVRDGLFYKAFTSGEICYVKEGWTLNVMGDTDRFSTPKAPVPPTLEDACTFTVLPPGDWVGANCLVEGEVVG
ncbi:MAG: hypothetical protein ACQ5SW_00925, partial [Sphaerochaetaceae bacterium]